MPKRRLGICLLLAATLLLPGAAAADPPPYGIVFPAIAPGTPLVTAGYQLYAANCSMCHGAGGEGITSVAPGHSSGEQIGLGPSLRGVGARSADFYLRTGYMPLSHVGAQPRRSRVLFSPRQIDAMVAYVASLGPGPGIPHPDPARGVVSTGLHLFTVNCAGCHQVVAQGGYLTGALAPPLEPDSPVEIAEAVRTGPFLMPRFSKSALTDGELNSIVAYLEYAKHPDDRGGWALGHLGPVPEGLVTFFLGAAVLIATCIVIGRRLKE